MRSSAICGLFPNLGGGVISACDDVQTTVKMNKETNTFIALRRLSAEGLVQCMAS